MSDTERLEKKYVARVTQDYGCEERESMESIQRPDAEKEIGVEISQDYGVGCE